MRSGGISVMFLILISVNAYTQVTEPIQDPSLNNLILPEGTITTPPETLGAIQKKGRGKQALIFIPGWGFAGEVYENFIRAYEETNAIYVVTLAGFGGTPPPSLPDSATFDRQYWMKGAVTGIVRLIREEKLHQPIILAHFSVGTQIALDLALHHPDEIGKVVILSGVPYRYYRPFTDTIWGREQKLSVPERTKIVDEYWAPAWYKTVTRTTWDSGNHTALEYSKDPDTGKMLFDRSAQVPMPVMIQYLLEFFTYDVSTRYKEISVPVLVLLPSFNKAFLEGSYHSVNQVISREWMKYFYLESWNSLREAGNPNIAIKTIPDTHVFLWYDNPRATYEAIDEFIK